MVKTGDPLSPSMIISDYRIEPADYQADLADLRAVRQQVFVAEQKIPPEIEFDGLDSHCQHVIARTARHQPIGTARMTPEHKIGRMAVLKEWRNRGVGKALLQALIDKAIAQEWTEIGANVQIQAKGFYEKQGFVATEDEFIEAGIPHQAMCLKLQSSTPPSRLALKAPRPTVPAAEFTTPDEARTAAIEIISRAGRLLCLHTRDLEAELYGRMEIIDAFKQFAFRRRDSMVRIIVQDITAARNQTHPLVHLAQRLPSTFSFRSPVEPEDIQYPSAFLVSDRDGYLFRLFGDRYKGHWSPALPRRGKQLQDAFDGMWQRSPPCSEFRKLSL